MSTEEDDLPAWASRARSVTRVLLNVYYSYGAVAAGIWLIDRFITDLVLPVPEAVINGLEVLLIIHLATGAVAGLMWWQGWAVAGRREREREREKEDQDQRRDP